MEKEKQIRKRKYIIAQSFFNTCCKHNQSYLAIIQDCPVNETGGGGWGEGEGGKLSSDSLFHSLVLSAIKIELASEVERRMQALEMKENLTQNNDNFLQTR